LYHGGNKWLSAPAKGLVGRPGCVHVFSQWLMVFPRETKIDLKFLSIGIISLPFKDQRDFFNISNHIIILSHSYFSIFYFGHKNTSSVYYFDVTDNIIYYSV